MITFLKVRNMFSFRDEVKMDLTSTLKKSKYSVDEEKKENFLDSYRKKSINSVSAIFGANASGKTNLMRVVTFIFFAMNADAPIGKYLDVFTKLEDKPTEFEIGLSNLREEFFYKVIIDPLKHIIIFESLTYIAEMSRTTKVLYKREDDNFEYDKNFITESIAQVIKIRKAESSILSFLFSIDFGNTLLENLSTLLKNIKSNVNRRGTKLDFMEGLGDFMVKRAIREEIYEKNEQLEEFTKKYDIGIREIKLPKVVLKNKKGKAVSNYSKLREYSARLDFSDIKFIHTYEKSESFEIPYSLESHGTKKLIDLFFYISNGLTNGGLVLLDEIDAFLHPLIIKDIVNLFLTKETNPNQAQLIITSHSPILLNLLQKEMIYIVDKLKNGVSIVQRLSDFNVNQRENFEKLYLNGHVGGIPVIESFI